MALKNKSITLSVGLLILVTTSNSVADEPSAAKPKIILAKDWGSDPLPIPESRKHQPRFITLHHAGVEWKAGDDPLVKAQNLQSWGKKTVELGGKDWPDLPYHFLIAPDGRILEGRPTEYEPETNTSYNVTGHIGVLLWGNFEVQRVSLAQVESAVQLVAWLAEKHQVEDKLIRGHQDVGTETDCPGKDFSRYLKDGRFNTWVNKARRGEPLAIELDKALEAGPTEIIPQ